MLKTAEILPAN